MGRIKVLITTPSADSKKNVSGIATFTGILTENNHEVDYVCFLRGRQKEQMPKLLWLLRQPLTIISFICTLIRMKAIKIVHINMPLEKRAIFRDGLLVLISAMFRKKIILHFHGGSYSLNWSTPLHLKMMIKLPVVLSDLIITLGEKEKDFVCKYYNCRRERVVIMSSAVNNNVSAYIKDWGSRPVILYLGRIDKNKGLSEITHSLGMLKDKFDAQLLIAGNGPDLNEFLCECEKQIPGKYEYRGVVSGKEKQMLLNKSHIFLLPSYYEGLPYSLLEAMSYKMIPVVTPVGSIPEVVSDGTNGFIVPVHDEEAILRSLCRLIENRKLMEEMGNKSYEVIRSRFSITGYVKKLNKIYYGLISE